MVDSHPRVPKKKKKKGEEKSYKAKSSERFPYAYRYVNFSQRCTGENGTCVVQVDLH